MQKKSKRTKSETDLETLQGLPVKVDYILLKNCFSAYESPKKKIFDLKKKGYLQQIQRGQYFNLKSRFLETTLLEVIANSLYFPSYISKEWALQYYGLIADRVTMVTSATILRSKGFKTPVAFFSFQHISKNRFPIGYVAQTNAEGDSFLIGRPEKALLDYVSTNTKTLIIKEDRDIFKFLQKDLRLDLPEFFKITTNEDIKQLLPFYHRNSKEHRILRWLQRQSQVKK